MVPANKQLQRLVYEYQRANQPWPATATEMATWAIKNKLWYPRPADLVAQCANQLSRAMREEHIIDPQGRSVRAKHAARVERDGEHVTLWGDIRFDPPQLLELAFAERRQQVVGDCKQLKTDIDSYNDNRRPTKPFQMSFDFTEDLIELGLSSNL